MKKCFLICLFFGFTITRIVTGYSSETGIINQCTQVSGSVYPSDSMSQSKDDLSGFGKWSNVEVSKSEDPHASGTEVEMWRHNGKLTGFLYEYVGPPADPPTGKLDDIEYDEKTGKISFRAKLTTGSVYSEKEKKWVPTKDIFIFKGTIHPMALIGDLEIRRVQDNGEEKTCESKILELKGKLGPDEYWEKRPYQEWVESGNMIMKSRGPKW